MQDVIILYSTGVIYYIYICSSAPHIFPCLLRLFLSSYLLACCCTFFKLYSFTFPTTTSRNGCVLTCPRKSATAASASDTHTPNPNPAIEGEDADELFQALERATALTGTLEYRTQRMATLVLPLLLPFCLDTVDVLHNLIIFADVLLRFRTHTICATPKRAFGFTGHTLQRP